MVKNEIVLLDPFSSEACLTLFDQIFPPNLQSRRDLVKDKVDKDTVDKEKVDKDKVDKDKVDRVDRDKVDKEKVDNLEFLFPSHGTT